MYEFVFLHVVGGIPIVLLKMKFDDNIIREGKVYASAVASLQPLESLESRLRLRRNTLKLE